ncbi:MAG: hypothetical protein HRU34_01025 [Richelia sp.]|nr:hypothetical protein [Richelia sp.]
MTLGRGEYTSSYHLHPELPVPHSRVEFQVIGENASNGIYFLQLISRKLDECSLSISYPLFGITSTSDRIRLL